MKFERILRIVNCEPWLITASAHAQIRRLLDARLAGMPMEPMDKPDKPEEMNLDRAVAVVPVAGVLGKGLSAIEKSCGACDVDDVAEALARAVDMPEATAILLYVDSPGGSVRGISELGDAVVAASKIKTVFAFTDGMMDSGAYWLSAGADQIYASQAAEVGGIGVYIPWIDETKAYNKEGLAVDIIKNSEGKFKGMGYPGTALTEEQRAHLQKRVDDIFAMFVEHITNNRPKVKREAMQGQSFLAADALEMGLIDAVAGFDAAISDALLL